ncbi:MAG: hypothetical protein WC370_05885 [Dehalococcoidales bacterium]
MDESVIREHSKVFRQIAGLSGVSLFCGVFSIICLMAVIIFRGDPPEDFLIAETAIIAVITGIMALIKIHKYPKLLGRGMAVAGVACGGAIVLYIMSFFMVVLVT